MIYARVQHDPYTKGQATCDKRRSGYVKDHYPEKSPQRIINTETLPRGAVLDVWAQSQWRNGIQIDELDEMQRIRVRTVYSLYEITVIDGRNGEILVKGGDAIPDLTEGQLT